MGATDSLYFLGKISTANRNSINTLLDTLQTGPASVSFVVYKYDTVANKYYKAFWTDVAIDGTLEILKGVPNLVVADMASKDVTSPTNYNLMFCLKPLSNRVQKINLSTGFGKPAALKTWGSL